MYPLGASLLIGLCFGWMAFLSAQNLFDRWWPGFIAGGAMLGLTIAGSMLNSYELFITAFAISVALFLIALIKLKITKG